MQQFKSAAHNTHSLNFHLIICTKYRRTVLTTETGDRVKEIIKEIAKEQNALIEAIETDVDHVHVMLNLKPTHSIPKLVHAFKGRSARLIFQEFPHIKIRLWKGHLWSAGYFVTTAGGAPLETLKNYVNSQKDK